MKKWKVGILGCGNIADIYVKNIQRYFENLEVISYAALHLESAMKLAQKYDIPKAYTKEEMLADEEVEVVVNLTVPKVHFALNQDILKAGKHVYSEKPLAMTCEEIECLMKLAERENKMIGCAPDTWLGASIQTCKKYIEHGEIGEIVSVTANLLNYGVEGWHPSPEFYYQEGGGPILDMGPYYITALVGMLGPIEEVYAFSRKGLKERVIYSAPLKGKIIPVEVETSYCGILKFASQVIANINMSFDVWESRLPMLEIYGTKGVLRVPDPNFFDGEIELIRQNPLMDAIRKMDTDERLVSIDQVNGLEHKLIKEKVEKVYRSPSDNLRGLGLWDMMLCAEHKKKHMNHPELVLHVMEVLTKLNKGEKNIEHQIKHKVACPDSIVEQIIEENGKSLLFTI